MLNNEESHMSRWHFSSKSKNRRIRNEQNMTRSDCAVSFFRNDLERTRLWRGECPVKNCSVKIGQFKVPFHKHKGIMRYLPFCPEHGLRIHKSGFVYYNGPSQEDLLIATKRNLMFHEGYYASNFFRKGAKMESGRLCYESSEDAVSYNVFAELLSQELPLQRLVSDLIGRDIKEPVDLYLWGSKIDLKTNKFSPYEPLKKVRHHLEGDIKTFATEPDIMLVVPKKIIICIEAKFGSKNPVAKEYPEIPGMKPKGRKKLMERYCQKNKIIRSEEIFDFTRLPKLFYEQLFRNMVFAASMAEIEGIAEWYVVNLRNQHRMNLKRGKPESMPMLRDTRALLKPKFKKRIKHLIWEQIYEVAIKGDPKLFDLAWYFKNKSFACGRAFNVI